MASLVAMPWIVINLGGEMLYVLEQRLKAQSVPAGKAARVLQDVAATLLDRAFLEEKLFVPQETYSLSSTKKIFERLAHSSIMRLSDASMDKLFDLMTMGAKYQLLASTTPGEMLQASTPVTQRHLQGIKAIVSAAGGLACADLAAHAEGLARSFYGQLSNGQLALLRETLLRFFQSRCVRVSLFLAEGIQAPDGRIVLPSCLKSGGGAGADVPLGRVRMFGADGRVASEQRRPLAVMQVDQREFFCHPVPLGGNLYAQGRPKVVPPLRRHDGAGGAVGSAAAAAAVGGGGGVDADVESRRPTAEEQPAAAAGGDRHAVRELDLLAGLIKGIKGQRGSGGGGGGEDGRAGAKQPPPDDNFRLAIFHEPGDGDPAAPAAAPPALGASAAKAAAGAGGARGGTDGGGARELEFGGASGASARNEAYRAAAGLTLAGLALDEGEGAAAGSGGGRGGAGAGGDDLLELMEAAGA
ncbi:hypothetical protein Rsub_05932 [Raphidocelis subcapitata]|uniref:Protein OSCP1 n=1 Tax=Raphidocelis subcapitata TaxID=307507 RepID=A0A2V0P5R1_9CHLO|nr:hypothetical protein Rsub_05932 [Raphidocelis subcapitata]|eukprot:GBF93200.1 hypothetical protein Rsub_05932 [Raphidocelis subcapitata]